jgi:hypothetical protein
MSDLLVEPMPVLAASFVSSSERGRKPGPYSMPGSGALMKGGRFAADSTLEEAVSSEPVSEAGNSLLAGKIQGISSIRGSGARQQ